MNLNKVKIAVRIKLTIILVVKGKNKMKFPLLIAISPGNFPIPNLLPNTNTKPTKTITSPNKTIIFPIESKHTTPKIDCRVNADFLLSY